MRLLRFAELALLSVLSSCYAEPVPACTPAAPFLQRAREDSLNVFELRATERQVVERDYNSSIPVSTIHLSHVFLIDDGHIFGLLLILPGDCVLRYQQVTLGQLEGISHDAARQR